MKDYILALDQGTTSCRAVLFDSQGNPAGMSQKEFTQIYPKAGWVEHDAEEIWTTQLSAVKSLLASGKPGMLDIAAIGITNQRETAVVWDRRTGVPIHNAIVWQSRQTAAICEAIKEAGHEAYIKEATGLVVDAYFSGTKVKWILDHVAGARERAEKGELLFGTMDTWLIWKLTGGKVHATEYSNASRTMMFNIRTLRWDDKLLEILDIPRAMLPEVRDSSGHFGETDPGIFGAAIPIAGAAGDQQAALFGQACFEPGMVKNTYGTGCFMLMQTGGTPVPSEEGLLTTIAWGLSGKVSYALEGSVFVAGAVIQWLRDELKLIDHAADSGYFAVQVPDTNGVYVVPAFAGLGAPYWDMYARGTIVGLTRGSGKNHIIRAALESIAYQSRDLLEVMKREAGLPLADMKVDGGASANDFLMQFQADLLGAVVKRPANIETTALGAAFLAGLGTGFWPDMEAVKSIWKEDASFEPGMDEEARGALYKGWIRAVERARGWAEPQS